MAVANSQDTLWLTVLPDMKNFGSSMMGEAEKQGDKGGGLFGSKFSKAFAATAAIGGTAIVASKQLYDIGATFDTVSDTIRVGTGATGDALEDMVESAKRIGTEIPAEFEQIGTTVADVNTRLGLTGETLEKFATQALEAGRIMGEEIDINAMSSAFNVFQIQGEDTTEAMDRLFQISQATGVGMNELATNVAANAPAVQALGFSFEETAALVGNLDKAGLNSSRMMAGLSRSLVNLAKDGEEPQEAFSRVVGEIEGFIEAGDQASAIDLAGQVFGTRNATQFIGAIESGTLALEDLESVAGMTEDTIIGVAEETNDFGEKWTIFKNKALVAIEPVASALFDKLGAGMTWLTDTAFPAVANFWDTKLKPVWDAFYAVIVDDVVPALESFWEDTLQPVITKIGEKVETVWEGVVQPAFEWLSTFITETVIPSVRELWEDSIQPALQSIQEAFQAWWGIIEPIFDAFYGWISNNIGPILEWLQTNIVEPVWDAITNAISTAWNTIKGIFDTIKNVLSGDFAGAWESAKSTVSGVWDGIWNHISLVWNSWILPLLKGVGDQLHSWFVKPFQDAVEAVGKAWDRVKEFFRSPINWVITNVINNGIIDFINAITGALGLSNLRISHVATIAAPPAARTFVPRTSGTSLGGGRTMVQARKDGGYTPPGWTLVGEEGPELVNFTHPNRVYTAAETQKMFGSQIDPGLIPDKAYDKADAHFALSALHSGDPDMLALAAGTSERDALLPAGGNILGAFGSWVSDAWTGLTSWTSDIAGKAVDFVRGRLADAAGLVVRPLQNAVRSSSFIDGVFEDFFVGAGDKLIDFVRGVDKDTKELPLSGGLDSVAESLLAGLGGGSVRPVAGGRLSSLFGPRWGGHHAGVDWAVPTGTPVRAWRPGVITRAGWNALAGRTGIGMTLAHAGGLGSYYGHLSQLLGSVGDTVRAGQVIGLSGNTGRSTGPHLHFEVSRGGNPQNVVNPLSYFDSGGWLMPGDTAARNATGVPEPVLTSEQWNDISKLALSADRRGDVWVQNPWTGEYLRAKFAETFDEQVAASERWSG